MSVEQENTYRRLFKEQYPRLFYYVLQMTHDEEVSRDIVSDTFARLWQGWTMIDVSRAPYMLMVPSAAAAWTGCATSASIPSMWTTISMPSTRYTVTVHPMCACNRR